MPDTRGDSLTDRRPKFAAVYHFAIGRLSPIAMAAYVVLAAHADNDRHDAWPGHAKIAEIGRMSRSSVKRALSELVEQKLISIRKVGRKGQEHNLYVLLFPASTQAKQGGMVPTDPRFSRNRGRSSENRGRSSQNPELDSANLDSVNEGERLSLATTKRRQAAALPGDFQPSEQNRQLCTTRGLVLETVLAKFRAYAQEHSRCSKDWQAALTRWILSERIDKPQSVPAAIQTIDDPAAASRREWAEHVARRKLRGPLPGVSA
jgi:hypothetical protein